MKMSRKEFLNISGKGILGFTLFHSLSDYSFADPIIEKIKSGEPMIDVKTKRLELAHTWTISRNSSDYKDNVFVKLESDGIIGYGEAAPNVRFGENAELTTKRISEAKEIFESNSIYHYMKIKDALEHKITDQSCAKAALDIALMDWIGKSFGVPLYKLLGLDPSDAPVTSFSIGIDTSEVIKQKVREAKPYPILKIKVGTERDKEIITTVRSVTNKPIRVDANEGWKSKETALKNIEWLVSQGVEFIEQPMPSSMLEETAWLRERAEIPIIADEAVKSSADIPLLAQAYDGINIKLMKSGGLLEAFRMIQMAKALKLKIMLGCMIESSVAVTAAAHLAPFVDWADLDGNLLISNDPFTGIKVKNGKLVFNNNPGLGVEGEF
jgi:L-alanine-DL-glutamate epimerase-like enolase superfamily enzyme